MCVWKGGGEESVCVYGRVWEGKGECVEEGGRNKVYLKSKAQNENYLPKVKVGGIYGYTNIATTSDLYVEGSLEPRCKEPSEGSNERGKDGEREGVELGRIEVDGHSTQLVEGGRRAEGKKAEQGGINLMHWCSRMCSERTLYSCCVKIGGLPQWDWAWYCRGRAHNQPIRLQINTLLFHSGRGLTVYFQLTQTK